MAKVDVTLKLSMSPGDAWAAASDLSRFDQWLTIHDGWRSALPEPLGAGSEVVSVVKAKGLRNRVVWKVIEFDAPKRVVLDGKGKGGAKFKTAVSVSPAGDGSEIRLVVDLGGPAMFGPVGAGVARALKGDLQTSLEKFSAAFG